MNKQMTLAEIDTKIPHLIPEQQYIHIPFHPYDAMERTVDDLQIYARSSNMTGSLVHGESSGIDSSTTLALGIIALGSERNIAVMMPYGPDLGATSLRYGRLVVEHLRVPKQNVLVRDIKSIVDAIAREEGWTNDDPYAKIRFGNFEARARMIIVMDLASKLEGRAAGAENKTEKYMKYFTYAGDQACHVNVLGRYYKTNVWRLGVILGIPQEIINKAPTADLWEGQTDEGELGVTYQLMDQVLYARFELKMTERQIAKTGIPLAIVQSVLKRVRDYEFKLHLPVEL